MLATTRLQITKYAEPLSLQCSPYLKIQTCSNLCAHVCNPAHNAYWYGAGGMSTAGKGEGGAYFFSLAVENTICYIS